MPGRVPAGKRRAAHRLWLHRARVGDSTRDLVDAAHKPTAPAIDAEAVEVAAEDEAKE